METKYNNEFVVDKIINLGKDEFEDIKNVFSKKETKEVKFIFDKKRNYEDDEILRLFLKILDVNEKQDEPKDLVLVNAGQGIYDLVKNLRNLRNFRKEILEGVSLWQQQVILILRTILKNILKKWYKIVNH